MRWVDRGGMGQVLGRVQQQGIDICNSRGDRGVGAGPVPGGGGSCLCPKGGVAGRRGG